MKFQHFLILLIFISSAFRSKASGISRADSLRHSIQHAKDDTTKVGSMIFLGEEIYLNNPDSALLLWENADIIITTALKKENRALVRKTLLQYSALALNNIGFIYTRRDGKKALEFFEKSLKIQQEVGDDKGLAGSLNNIGSIYHQQGDISKALEYYHQSLDIKEKINDKNSVAVSLNNIGNIYADLGNTEKALDYFHRSLKIHEEQGDKDGAAFAINNIASVYSTHGDDEKALEYYTRSLKIREEIKDQYGISISMANIGSIYQATGKLEKAREYYLKAQALQETTDDKRGLAATLVNLGYINDLQGEMEQGLKNYEKALKMFEELNDKKGVSHTLNNIARIYNKTGDLKKALEYANKGFYMAKEMGYPTNIAHSTQLLYEIYKKQNNGMKALEMHELYMQMKDSISNETSRKASLKKQLQYEYEKKAAADSVLNLEKSKLEEVKHEQEISEQRMYTYSGTIGFALMMMVAGVSFRAYRQKQKANDIIALQKNIVEEKQKEILDSINYAQRIQSAILAKEEDIKKHLPESFLLYIPKDIVAGDFYFFETTSTHLFYAAADCTGHGVPGALVSVVCSNALSRCVKEFNLADPGKILDKASELVVETFNKSGKDLKDGMDISLLVKELSTSKYTWAGANNSLWIARENEMIEYKSNKQSIGSHENHQPFTSHEFDAKKGDTIYLYTDGYADQFGGEKGKKFKYKQLQQKLISIHALSMEEQKVVIQNNFNEWKGNLEQVDDVCIIGLKV
ncbi:MAG: tetratricopeptide repeat protein [Bacteroidota bacterium]|nr:tetratricopeptide repeat protein [Bacteroidota bacterium]